MKWYFWENVITMLVAAGLSIFLVLFTGNLWGLLGLIVLLNLNCPNKNGDDK